MEEETIKITKDNLPKVTDIIRPTTYRDRDHRVFRITERNGMTEYCCRSIGRTRGGKSGQNHLNISSLSIMSYVIVVKKSPVDLDSQEHEN